MTKQTSRKPTPARRMKTGSVLTKDYTIEELKDRQEREGFSFGYLSHEIRSSPNASRADRAVLAFLHANSFDAVDAYHALNSRCARHMGDALSDIFGFPTHRDRTIEQEIALNLGWTTPAQMYAAFGETRDQLEKGAR